MEDDKREASALDETTSHQGLEAEETTEETTEAPIEETTEAPVEETTEAPVEEEPPDPAEVAGIAEEFVRGLVSAMGLSAEVSSSVDDDRAHVDVHGEGLGVLIGRRGQALEALQELARTAVQRRVRARTSLLIDVEGYRARRREELVEYAREIAERARERGTEIELEPMNSYERRIVHNAVSEIDGATSFSEGEEPDRKVIVRAE